MPTSTAAACSNGHVYNDENTYVSPQGHRSCRACNREKSRRRYYANREKYKAEARARYHADREAGKKRVADWGKRNPEKRAEYDRRWRERNKDARNAYARDYWERTRDRDRDKRKDWQLQTEYGITLADYRQLEEQQGGLCAICIEPPDRDWLCVDHDHETGEVRGLLCNGCNSGLGMFKDDRERLAAAMEYLDGG